VADFKLLGGTDPVLNPLGDMLQGIGYPLRGVDESPGGGTVNVSTIVIIQSNATTDQVPVAVDTPLQVNYGAGGTSAKVDINPDGTITFIEAGDYTTQINLSVGRANNVSEAYFFIRGLLNGIEFPRVSTAIVMGNNQVTVPVKYNIHTDFAAGDELVIQVYQDSTGDDDGGLYSVIPTLAGWDPSSSAAVFISQTTAVAV
jgi:hypothetical protein